MCYKRKESNMNPTREIDEQFSALFSVFHPFSQHLTKREDNQLRDKYDHNAFMYTGQPSVQEIRQALDYQQARGDTFLKLEGYEPLENTFGMESPDTILTMILPEAAGITGWKINPDVSLQTPGFEELERHELKYYGPLYGEDFTVRNNRRLREKLTYRGAYLEGKLVGSCYTYSAGGYTCMDSLVVDEDYRHRYVATTLIRQIAEEARAEGKILYLHADQDDTPKNMYARMGFEVVDTVFEYLCTDFKELKLD